MFRDQYCVMHYLEHKRFSQVHAILVYVAPAGGLYFMHLTTAATST